MRRVGRAVVTGLVAVTVAGGLGACGKKDDQKKELIGLIDRTEVLPHRFAYLDQDLSGSEVGVTGLVEDDFRYKARLAIDGKPIWDEVVSDDAVADQFLDADGLLAYSKKATAAALETLPSGTVPTAAGSTGATAGTPSAPSGAAAASGSGAAATPAAGLPLLGADVDFASIVESAPPTAQPQLKALAEHRWVEDPIGAPSLAYSPSDSRMQGQDPMYDALTTLEYVRRAIQAAAFVKKYDKDTLEPVYRPEEDPFPKPDKSSGIVRYDLKEPPLPAPSTTGAGKGAGNAKAATPGPEHFRKMAVYAQNGRIIEVREVIDIQSKLKDLSRNFAIQFPAELSARGQVVFAVKRINALSRGTNPPLRVRQMTLQLRDLGDKGIAVSMPTADLVQGSLFAIVPGRGRAPKGAASATTTTAPVAAAASG